MYTIHFLTSYSLVAIAFACLCAVVVGWALWASGGGSARVRPAVLTSACIVPFALFVFAVVTLSVNVPYWDDYDAILSYLAQPFPQRMSHLFAFHNEHRIVFVRVVMEAVYGLCGTFDFRAMIYVGNALFLLFVGLVLHRLKRNAVEPRWWCIAVAWSLLSILMFENMFWALTSVQNNAVLLFAWLALLCLERGRRHVGWFFAALTFAVLCTYTSGSGMFIWPCMAGLFAKTGFYDGERPSPLKLVVLGLVAVAAVAYYLHGFQGQGQGALEKAFAHPFRVFTYAALFCGASMNFPSLAFPLGMCVFVFAGFLLFSLKRVRDNVTLFFLCFLLLSAMSAALFRCGDTLTQALSFRYRVIAVSIIVCCGMLAYEQWAKPFSRYARPVCAAVTAFCIFMNLSAYLLSYPQLVARRDRHLAGLHAWPADCSGLVYPDTARASAVLQKSVESGAYRPAK